ncbi:hypothetical protein JCM10450v2_008214 [Rhodotorula kratochvilovae]
MSAQTPAPTPTASPRVTLDNLPTEVKIRIAELCAEQDERFEEWTAAVEDMDDTEGLLDRVQAHHGRTLGALFCLSKEWSDIVAPLRFQVLKVSRTDEVEFQFWISYTRIHFFTTLILDEASPAIFDSFLPIFSRLCVKSVDIEPPFFNHSFSNVAVAQRSISSELGLSLPRRLGMQAFRRLISTVASLTLRFEGEELIKSVLQHTSDTLAALRLDLSATKTSVTAAVRLIARLPSLTTLQLDLDASSRLPIDPSTLRALDLPNLGKITMTRAESFEDAVAFAALFSRSVRAIHIEVSGSSVVTNSEREDMHAIVFGQLSSLTLVGREDALEPFAPFLTPHSFPALRILHIEGRRLPSSIDVSDLAQQIKAFLDIERHPLVQIRYYERVCPPDSDTILFAYHWNNDQRATFDVGKSRVPAAFTFEDCPAYHFDNEETTETGRADIARTVEFIVDWHRRAAAGGPTAPQEYWRLAKVLVDAEFERFAMQQ